jgi:hypothetical protein
VLAYIEKVPQFGRQHPLLGRQKILAQLVLSYCDELGNGVFEVDVGVDASKVAIPSSGHSLLERHLLTDVILGAGLFASELVFGELIEVLANSRVIADPSCNASDLWTQEVRK